MKSKVITLLFLLLILFTTTCFAKPIVTADQQYLDINTGLYVLNGNVHIEVGNRIITAGQAKVNMTTMEVWGSGGITVTQGDIYFSGDTVYVYGLQNHAAINGNVNFNRTNLQITADAADYNWDNKIAFFNGNVHITQNDNAWTTDSIKYNVDTNSII